MDQFKSESSRETTQVYDYLGDIGGFQSAFSLLFSVIAGFFSSRYFASDVASSLYVQKKSKDELKSLSKSKKQKKKIEKLEQISQLK